MTVDVIVLNGPDLYDVSLSLVTNPDVLRVLVSIQDDHVLIELYHSYQWITSSDSYTTTLLVWPVQSYSATLSLMAIYLFTFDSIANYFVLYLCILYVHFASLFKENGFQSNRFCRSAHDCTSINTRHIRVFFFECLHRNKQDYFLIHSICSFCSDIMARQYRLHCIGKMNSNY